MQRKLWKTPSMYPRLPRDMSVIYLSHPRNCEQCSVGRSQNQCIKQCTWRNVGDPQLDRVECTRRWCSNSIQKIGHHENQTSLFVLISSNWRPISWVFGSQSIVGHDDVLVVLESRSGGGVGAFFVILFPRWRFWGADWCVLVCWCRKTMGCMCVSEIYDTQICKATNNFASNRDLCCLTGTCGVYSMEL